MNDFFVSFLLVRGGMVLAMLALFAFVSGAPDVGWMLVYLLMVLGFITGTEYTMGYWKRLHTQVRKDLAGLREGLRIYRDDLRESTLQPFAWLFIGLCLLVVISCVVVGCFNS